MLLGEFWGTSAAEGIPAPFCRCSTCLEARSRIATTFVADGDYDAALEQSMLVLEQEETNASALATAAICYGLLKDPILSKRYTQLAVDNGYSEKKITETISALKKR